MFIINFFIQLLKKPKICSFQVHLRLPLHEYAHRHTTVIHRAILFKPIEFPSVGKYNPLLNDILKSCLERDPSKRPTVQELLDHPYLKK